MQTHGAVDLQELPADPATPASGFTRLFAKTDGKLYRKDDAGVVSELGAAGGGGGANPVWAGALHAASGDGEPDWETFMEGIWGAGTVAITQTNIGITVGRVWAYRSPFAITATRLRWYATAGAGVASGFRFGMWAGDGLSQALPPQTLTLPGADRWCSHDIPDITLAANTLYYCCLSTTAAATTNSIRGMATPLVFPPLQASTPGNLALAAGEHSTWFGQVTLVNGVQPAVMPALVRGSAWVGGIPTFFFDANAAA